MRKRLDELRLAHIPVAMRFMSAADGAMFTFDMLLIAIMQRSVAVADAVLDAVDAQNLLIAAPLVRLQLDTLVRLSFIARSGRHDEWARSILKGEELRNMRDQNGQKLTDAVFLNYADEHHDWVRPVYRATSGWVHLSPNHMLAALTQASDGAGNDFQTRIPMDGSLLPPRLWAELLGATAQATEEILRYVDSWGAHKEAIPAPELRDRPNKGNERAKDAP